MYSLYIDKPTEFACDISVKNASLKNSVARMVVKSEGLTLLFEGKIKDGKCVVPIGRLKGLLDENTKGRMNLEIIVEDTYFSPWQDDFSAEEHTSVKVKVNESKQSTKPTVIVKVPKTQPKKAKGSVVAIMELKNLCNKFGFTKSTLPRHKEDFRKLINEYFNANPEFIIHRKKILNTIKYLLK